MARYGSSTSSDLSSTLTRVDLPSLRRRSRIRTGTGFTIVELLIVIVVIAVLAAITIVAYNGITGRARDVSLKSDLQGAASQLEADNTTNGSYPSSAAAANGGQGLKSSPGNTLTYVTKPYGYCVSASNPGDPNVFALRSNTGQIQSGTCDTVVSTLAGSGTAGFADGTGAAAQFKYPEAVAVDTNGIVYVADGYNNRIRTISPAGVVSTLAGSGVAGYADGAGTAAQFSDPLGIAVDANGNVYVADGRNNRIRKITPSGVVTTVAGSGVQGCADGTGTAAQFSYPTGITVDSSGNLYVTDVLNCDGIRKITPAGVVTRLAGGTRGYADGTGAAAQFNQPYGIAVDAAGNVYVADNNNNNVRKVTPSGVVTTIAGSTSTTYGYADGTGTSALFNFPCGIAVDSSGTLYVADSGNARIRKITSGGVVTTIAGSGTQGYADGVGTSAQFQFPANNLAVDATGNVYVSDQNNNRIRKIVQ